MGDHTRVPAHRAAPPPGIPSLPLLAEAPPDEATLATTSGPDRAPRPPLRLADGLDPAPAVAGPAAPGTAVPRAVAPPALTPAVVPPGTVLPGSVAPGILGPGPVAARPVPADTLAAGTVPTGTLVAVPETATGTAPAAKLPVLPPVSPDEPPVPTGAPRRARRAPLTRGRKIRRTILAVVATVGVIVLTVAGMAVLHLNGNLRSDQLYAGETGNAGKETPDTKGRTPINILLIGSDTRASQVDCAIGGGCGGGANADVQMVVHVAADRSNATVMSIPRDLVTHLPACVATKGTRMPAHVGQINSTLAYGPGCTVAAVHELTGIPIDHFVMVDFAGVIAMSDAVGGAQICVDDNVFDTYSQLKLSKGRHTLKGLAALQFVRSRHGFGDGSDLGRTYAQHLFLSAVIRNMKSAGTLTNPGTLYELADTATKALTVDHGLGSIPSLLGLATDIRQVPTERIIFTTMQNQPDPADANRVVAAPAAKNLFTTIINDQSLSPPPPAPKGTAESHTASATPAPAHPPATPARPASAPAATATVARSAIVLRVSNASGVRGRAEQVLKAVLAQGFGKRSGYAPNTAPANATVLAYGPGLAAQARTVAAALHLPATALKQTPERGLTLVVGKDWLAGNTYPSTTPAPVSTQAALADSHAQTANQSQTCAQVSHQATVNLNGVSVSPPRAYALARSIPDSAP